MNRYEINFGCWVSISLVLENVRSGPGWYDPSRCLARRIPWELPYVHSRILCLFCQTSCQHVRGKSGRFSVPHPAGGVLTLCHESRGQQLFTSTTDTESVACFH